MWKRFSKYASRTAAVLLVAYWVVIFIGTHTPSGPDAWLWVSDKMLHFGAYAGLGVLLGWVIMRRKTSPQRMVIAWLIILVYGALDELSQRYVPRRTPDLNDWYCDILGAAVGLILFVVMRWLMAKYLIRAAAVAAA